MKEKQPVGMMSFWRLFRDSAGTPDPVISPDAPSRLDIGDPSPSQYPACNGSIPIGDSDAESQDAIYAPVPVRSYS